MHGRARPHCSNPFLVGSTALLVGIANSCSSCKPDPPPATPLIVDTHAHVMHAEDVPIRAFVEKVVGAPEWAARWVEWLLLGRGELREQLEALGEPSVEYDEDSMRAVVRATLSELDPRVRARRAPPRLQPSALDRANPDRVIRPVEAVDDELQLTLTKFLEEPRWSKSLPPKALFHAEAELIATPACPEPPASLVDGIRGVLRFARILSKRNPSTVADVYFDTYSDQHGAPIVDLVTPAMMNMESWLGQKSKHSIDEQIEELGVLVQARKGRVHPFFAFDPCTPWDKSRAQLERALELGFIGVKVYPPMGYLPWGNTGKKPACDWLPCDDALIDANLGKLYEHCRDKGIPILAHCSNPGAAACKQAGKNADPKHWADVLTTYEGLHVSFGHFGGSDFVAQGAWLTTIVDLMVKHPGVYADLSYHGWSCDPSSRDCYVTALDKLLNGPNGALIAQRTVFGTDWSMISREPWQRRFVSELLQVFADKFPTRLNGVAGQNALEFLGLRSGRKNYDRLMQYYARVGIDPATVPWVAHSAP
jgi:predicted TIM-barrel fold metal-dependent hydrolase